MPQTFGNGLSELEIHKNSPVSIYIYNVKNFLGPSPRTLRNREGTEGKGGEGRGGEGKGREGSGTKRRTPQFFTLGRKSKSRRL
jgi:hypothetical protein